MGYNVCFMAGADKGVAYELYNSYFGGQVGGGRLGVWGASRASGGAAISASPAHPSLAMFGFTR